MDVQERQAQLGLCMVEFVSADVPRYEQYFGKLNFGDQEALKSLGEQLGMQMASVCPDILMSLVSGDEATGQANAPAPTNEQVVTGTFVGVGTDGIPTVNIRQENGRPMKLLWLEYWPGSDDVAALEGKAVTLAYEFRDLYDAGTGGYVTYKVVTGLR